MKIEVSQATGSISDYAKQARKETVLLTRAGKPVAAVVAPDEADWEDFVLSTNPEFLAVLERSRVRWREEVASRATRCASGWGCRRGEWRVRRRRQRVPALEAAKR